MSETNRSLPTGLNQKERKKRKPGIRKSKLKKIKEKKRLKTAGQFRTKTEMYCRCRGSTNFRQNTTTTIINVNVVNMITLVGSSGQVVPPTTVTEITLDTNQSSIFGEGAVNGSEVSRVRRSSFSTAACPEDERFVF